MFERYTERARRVVFRARYEASRLGSRVIECEHLLLGLLAEDKPLAEKLLHSQEALDAVRRHIEQSGEVREKISTSVDLPLSGACKRALMQASDEAESLGHRHIDTTHLLLGLLRVEPSTAADLLAPYGVNSEIALEIARAQAPATPPSPGYSMSARPRPAEWPDLSEQEPPEPAALSLRTAVLRLRLLVEQSLHHLDNNLDSYGFHRLKRKPWTRKEALEHLIDLATTHHGWFARALTEPVLTAPGYPGEDWVTAQRYAELSWRDLVDAWASLGRLLAHVLSAVPEEKAGMTCRIGIEPPVPLSTLAARYVERQEDLMGQILARL